MRTPVHAAKTEPGCGQNRLCRKLRAGADLDIGSACGLPQLVFLLPALRILLLSLLLVPCSGVPADGAEEFVRQSIRARGMGNAFTAIANDEFALYYNPAGLQSVQVYMFEIASLQGTANQKLIDLVGNALETASNEELADSFSDVAGKRYYAEGGLSGLSITGPGWGYSIFANAVADIAVNNPTVPFFDVRVYGQIGALTGVGYSLMNYELDVGVAIKVVRRIGVQRTFHIVDFAPALRGEFDDLIDSGSDVTAYAPDVGVIYHYDRYHDYPLKFAVVAQNIGGLDFDAAGEVPMTINVGASTEVEMLGFDVTFAADELDLLGAQDTERDKSYVQDLKLGVEAGLFKLFNGHHLVSFRFGRNGVYNAFGFSLNVFGLKIDYAQWSEEVGSFAGSQEDQRQAIKITLIF